MKKKIKKNNFLLGRGYKERKQKQRLKDIEFFKSKDKTNNKNGNM